MAQTRPNFDPATGDDTSGALRKLDNNCNDLDTRVVAVKSTADAALPKTGGNIAGSLVVTGTITTGGILVTTASTLGIGAKGASGRVDIYPNTETTVGRASVLASGQLQLDGTLQSKGVVTRAGTGGAIGANVYNINWTNVASLYIDSAFIGNFNFATSDPRLKKAIVYLDSAADGDDDIEKVLAMKPCTWRYADIGLWHDDGVTRRSFLSPEMQDIDPMLAEGDRDAVNEDGTPAPLNLGLEAILSTVAGALRREIMLRRALEGRVSAMEAAGGARS
jgi:hypothetical protein